MSRRMLLAAAALLAAQTVVAQIGGRPGAFARMGFGARGMGMGNALTAVTKGEIAGYYNPAVLPHAATRTAAAAFGVLSLDRRLNFLHYTQPVHPTAGISAGIINAGVSRIDGRDSDGEPTGDLQTSENQVFLAFANRFGGGLSLGINVKLYYHRLYTEISALSMGLDFGALYTVTEDLTIGGTVRDLNSAYRWDTSELYGQSGNTTRDRFPVLYTGGAAWRLPDSTTLVSAEIEASNRSTLRLRLGAEYPVIPELTLRAGVDRIDLREQGAGAAPTAGFSVQKGFGTWTPALHYAYVHEPFAPNGMHIISLSVTL